MIATKKTKYNTTEWLFYWSLLRGKLKNMESYFGALVDFDNSFEKEILYIGQSINERCHRALIARDTIGFEYFKGDDFRSWEKTLYHFDYLLILLAGSFDAAARIAWRVYKIKTPNEYNASFRNPKAIKAIKEVNAKELFDLINSVKFKKITDLLYNLRNTIHGASNPTVHFTGSESGRFITPFVQYHKVILDAAQACGPIERWGIDTKHQLRIRPYIFSVILVEECLELLDALCSKTEMARLFPDEKIPKTVADRSEQRLGHFGPQEHERISILG